MSILQSKVGFFKLNEEYVPIIKSNLIKKHCGIDPESNRTDLFVATESYINPTLFDDIELRIKCSYNLRTQ